MLCPASIAGAGMSASISRTQATTGDGLQSGRASAGRAPQLRLVSAAPAAEPMPLMLPAVAERFALLNLMGQATAHARRTGKSSRARAGAPGLTPTIRSAGGT